jgi:hypothetical protein
MNRPRVQITLAWLMFAVVGVGVLVWLCKVTEYHLSGRAYDDWVDGASCPISFKHRSDPATVEPTVQAGVNSQRYGSSAKRPDRRALQRAG